MKTPLAFICARLTDYPGGTIFQNTERAATIARIAHNAGYLPFIPHLNFMYLDATKPEEDAAAVAACLKVIPKCNVLILDDRRGVTKHMNNEVKQARKHKIPVVMVAVLLTEFKQLEDKKHGKDKRNTKRT